MNFIISPRHRFFQFQWKGLSCGTFGHKKIRRIWCSLFGREYYHDFARKP